MKESIISADFLYPLKGIFTPVENGKQFDTQYLSRKKRSIYRKKIENVTAPVALNEKELILFDEEIYSRADYDKNGIWGIVPSVNLAAAYSKGDPVKAKIKKMFLLAAQEKGMYIWAMFMLRDFLTEAETEEVKAFLLEKYAGDWGAPLTGRPLKVRGGRLDISCDWNDPARFLFRQEERENPCARLKRVEKERGEENGAR
ncbi:MAG: hypothetical protein HFH19_08170 [Ruminococcus sp.]|jgi:hypothetical protein|nr:hypothetical protein [Ruminococcus sp.]